ncbi:MAG: PAS-domain containing protein [Rhodospirillales bacterium]|nr:PAS-domain containing protein [Rhodospirillales bacterium]
MSILNKLMSMHPAKKHKKFLENLFGRNRAELEKNRLEAFLDSVPGAYCGWDRDGGIAWNETFLTQLHLKDIKDFTTIQTSFAPEEAPILEGAFRSLRESGEPFCKVCAARDGMRFFRLSGNRGFNLAEDDYYDVIWLEDVSEHHGAQGKLALRAQQAERDMRAMRDACDSTPFPVWLRNETLDLVWCNRAYAELLGLSVSQILTQQQELTGTLTGTGGKKEKIEMKRLAAEAQEKSSIASCRGHLIVNGKRRLFLFEEIPQKKEGGYMGMARDITREEELTSELGHHVTASHTLLDHLHSAVGIFNKDQELEFYNASFASLWKLEEPYLNTHPKLGDIMERLRAQRSLPEQADFRGFKKSWLDMFTGLLQPFEDMLYLPDEKVVRMLVVAHPLGGLMMTFEDVTSRLALESSYNTLIAVQKGLWTIWRRESRCSGKMDG